MMVNLQEVMSGSGQRRTDSSDEISELPENVKENILDRLTIEDAVRTSILSSKWRYAWTSRKRLDFGMAFTSLIEKYTGEMYAEIIDKILLLHHGPIEHVSLRIPKGVRRDMIDLNAWFLNWSRKGIQELEINASNHMLGFFLPSWLFQCQSLRSLRLMFCGLRPPPDFCGFFNLVTLYLWNVTVSPDSLGIGTLISRCRQLEKLFIHCDLSSSCQGTPLIINAPNLTALEFQDFTSGNIIFENVPRLTDVTLGRCVNILMDSPVKHSEVYGSFDVLSSLHSIEMLNFDLSLLETLNGDCPQSLPVPYMNLKSLRLIFFSMSIRENIAFVFCLLRSAPNLKTFDLGIYQSQVPTYPEEAAEVSRQCLEVEEGRANNLNKLITINFGLMKVRYSRTYDYEPMFKLIKILLASCPVLETLNVAPDWQHEPDAVKLDWVKKLLQFRRLSSTAEIVIIDY